MNILITGAGGYIGRGVTERLLQDGHTIIDYCRSLKDPYKDPRRIYVYGEMYDVSRMLEVFRNYDVDRVVHIAAQSSPSVSLDVPFQTVYTNITCTAALLEAARLKGIKRVVLYSSDAAYGDHNYAPITLNTALFPRTPYGVTKAATEMLGRAYNWSFGMDCVSLRVGMVYGGAQITPNWVKSSVESAIRGEKYVLPQGADQTLELVHIDDVVGCSYAAIFAEKINELAVYNVVSHCVLLKDTLNIVKKLIPSFEFDVGPGKITEAQGSWDISDTVKDLNFTPRYSLEEGISRYIAFMRDHI
jgi:UDP-glucose 4-epimerase